MAELTAGFETGVNGNDILVADAGDADAWQTSAVSSSGTRTYDSTRAHGGTLSYKLVTGGTASTTGTGVGWTTSGGMDAATDHFGRIYLYLTGNPSAGMTFMQFPSVASRNVRLDINATGFLRMIDSPATGDQAGAVAISLNQWIRIEWHIIHSATVGQVELKLFNDADSATPSETITSPATWNTGTSAGGAYFGSRGTSPAGHTFWWDQIIANATSYPGPSGQTLLPDADTAEGGWTTAPLFSKVNDSADGTIITATAA